MTNIMTNTNKMTTTTTKATTTKATKINNGSTFNILNTYSESTLEELELGEAWYPIAHQFCVDLAKEYGCSLRASTGVVAALSPRNRWENNMSDATNIIRYYLGGPDIPVHTYGRNRSKALDILKGGDPNLVLGGNKVRSFYLNILNPNDESIVTIDSHAYNVWQGAREVGVIVTDKDYKAASLDYIAVAKHLGTKPLHAQAVVWVTFRRIHNI
jgi:hypothetical protein